MNRPSCHPAKHPSSTTAASALISPAWGWYTTAGQWASAAASAKAQPRVRFLGLPLPAKGFRPGPRASRWSARPPAPAVRRPGLSGRFPPSMRPAALPAHRRVRMRPGSGPLRRPALFGPVKAPSPACRAPLSARPDPKRAYPAPKAAHHSPPPAPPPDAEAPPGPCPPERAEHPTAP